MKLVVFSIGIMLASGCATMQPSGVEHLGKIDGNNFSSQVYGTNYLGHKCVVVLWDVDGDRANHSNMIIDCDKE